MSGGRRRWRKRSPFLRTRHSVIGHVGSPRRRQRSAAERTLAERSERQEVVADAKAIDAGGCFLLELEGVWRKWRRRSRCSLRPTSASGSPACDGQVLVKRHLGCSRGRRVRERFTTRGRIEMGRAMPARSAAALSGRRANPAREEVGFRCAPPLGRRARELPGTSVHPRFAFLGDEAWGSWSGVDLENFLGAEACRQRILLPRGR